MKPPQNVLVISDMHAPFQHRHTLDFLRDTYRKFKCNRVICIGDEVDFHTLSVWPREHDSKGTEEEVDEALKFLKQVYKLFPYVQVCESNHTSRPFRLAHKNGLSSRFLKTYNQFLEAPSSWQWVDRIIVDDTLYFHGDGYSGEKGHINAAIDARMNTVIGHLHGNGGVNYIKTSTGQIYAMNVGCLINEEAYAFRYGKYSRRKPTIGCGVVLEGKRAYFEPLL